MSKSARKAMKEYVYTSDWFCCRLLIGTGRRPPLPRVQRTKRARTRKEKRRQPAFKRLISCRTWELMQEIFRN
jgi:hypothetical protein